MIWSFEAGHYDGPTGQVPNGFTVTYEEGLMLPGADQPTIKPETNVKHKSQIPPHEHELFFREGAHCFKMFTSRAPISATLHTEPLRLEAGATYHIRVPVFVDVYYIEDNQKQKPTDPAWDARLRVGLTGETSTWTRWFDDATVRDFLLEPITLTADLVAPTDTASLSIQFQARWGAHNNGIFLDAITLEKANGQEPDPPVAYPYPTIRHGSKLSVHGIKADGIPDFSNKLSSAGTKFTVVKAVDDIDWLVEIKRTHPEIITLARFTSPLEGCAGVDQPSSNLTEMARALVDVILERATPEQLSTIDYWEICNEPDPPGAYGYRRLSQLMIECMDVAEEHGLKLGVFALNNGTPEYVEMQAMVETGVFAHARAGGHILTLHEGTFNSFDPKLYWGDTIPGSPHLPTAGALNFRHRYLYDLLPPSQIIPLVISEWYCGNHQDEHVSEVEAAIAWYDEQASADFYHLGFCPFTLGPTSQWEHTDFGSVYPGATDHMIEIKDRENQAAASDCLCPREPYLRSYILLPQLPGFESMIWRACTAIATADSLETVGHSADDAGVGPQERYVTAVNPQEWGDLEPFFDEHYPGLNYEAVTPQTPYECGVLLRPTLTEDIAIGQSDSRWSDWDFGEGYGGTIGQYGCFLTGFTMIFRGIGFDITPPVLDLLLRMAQVAYTDDNLSGWSHMPNLFPSFFDEALRDNAHWSTNSLAQLLSDNWHVILPKHNYEHFVLLEKVEGDSLTIIDTSDGQRKTIADDWAGGVRALHSKQEAEPILYGLHDRAGGEWMIA